MAWSTPKEFYWCHCVNAGCDFFIYIIMPVKTLVCYKVQQYKVLYNTLGYSALLMIGNKLYWYNCIHMGWGGERVCRFI